MSNADFWVDLVKGQSPVRPWDKLIIGNYVFPGILVEFTPEVSLSADIAKQMTSFDSKNGPSYKIRITDKGYEPARIRAVLALWDNDMWEDVKDGMAKLSPKESSRSAIAWDINHPTCALLGIKSVIVTRVGVPLPVNHTLFVQIDMLQWYPGTPFKIARSTGGALPVFNVDGVKPTP